MACWSSRPYNHFGSFYNPIDEYRRDADRRGGKVTVQQMAGMAVHAAAGRAEASAVSRDRLALNAAILHAVRDVAAEQSPRAA